MTLRRATVVSTLVKLETEKRPPARRVSKEEPTP
jgi:hypothetical protein